MSVVLIVGGGAAGMAAAIASAENGHEVHLYEKNEKPGRKLYITGKGRCNVTNACSPDDFFRNVVSNPRFLYSSFCGFSNQDIMRLLEESGCPLKVERGDRVFPVSDRSADVIDALVRRLRKLGVHIHTGSNVSGLLVEDGQCRGLLLKQDARDDAGKTGRGGQAADISAVAGDAVIVATGGKSYASTGSTGDGYRFAESCGHTVTELLPSLVPFNVKEAEAKELQGLSLKNVEVSISDGGKELFREFGEMLFTHFGVSGPVILSASSYVGKILCKRPLQLAIDLKPALSAEQLDARLLRDFAEFSNRRFSNALGKLFPSKLIPVMIARSGIEPDKAVRDITRAERRRLLEETKHFTFTLTGLRGFEEAIITRGGVSVKEISPSTMESKKVRGLYFAGEVLDLDAVTGGFNLQIAWSTGWAAGSSVL